MITEFPQPSTKVPINSANNSYLYSKRVLDILLSLVGILLLLPFFLVICILIKSEDWRSTIFFKQQRVGRDGKMFFMYKFRSMVSNAEALKATLANQNEATGPIFKIKHDPRVTKIGRFIRKTSIDELPQLLNVLKGEMSLVGPRPPLPDEVALYTSYEKKRLAVTPGLTCYWQVSGRSSIGFEEWVALDLKYIQERCILVDLKLIFKTVFVLFGSNNAY
ncbi:sugar transferase [Planomicrobium sp. CPCC 101110]|uniref:sugar transferase n=1 Tax=Planomicrobium sp. CPCC 101110 TaxID=2599619 RepID=UPI0011B3D9EF|nr:sugar transferase [Planomicrobium sp. CPCC 101110]TWT28433.1 sugar transferase [Planomicrobium sp. CPCC 101110]